jgi:hypothetical protein
MRRFIPLALVLLCLGPAARAADSAPPLDPSRDARLARKVRLRAEGIPVAWVLKALGEKTGVSLQATGIAGDERLVAFVPEAPLGEVLECIADLYRLSWSREGNGTRPAYRLQKLPAATKEEQTLRDRAVAQVLERLSERFRRPVPEGGGREEPWAPVYPELLPILAQRGGVFTRDGYLRLPVASLLPAERDRIVAKLTPILQAQDERRSIALQQIREDEIARGIPPDQATHDKPPSDPLQSILTADLQLTTELQASVGLRSNTDTWYHWFQVHADDLTRAAQALYDGSDLHVPDRSGGAETVEPPAGDPLSKVVELRPDEPARAGDWVGSLGRLSDAAGVPIYADWYANYLEGASGHPRAQMPASGRGSAARFLDALCYPTVPAGWWSQRGSSFWWRRGDAALVRSRRWIWEEQTIPPAALLERAIDAVRRTGTLTAAEVPGLAALRFLQLQQGDSIARHLEDWRRAVQVPADQAALARLLPGEDPTGFRARLRTELHDFPAQGGAVLTVSFFATPMRGAHPFYLPLPGVAPTRDLPARGLEVTLR